MPSIRSLVALLAASCCFVACGGDRSDDTETGPGTGQPVQAAAPAGFSVWHADFPGAPGEPYLSPAHPGTYDRTRRQALESVAAKLQGNCTREAWLFAKDLFSRVEPADTDVLVVTLDRALQVPELADLAENVVEAMGRAATPRVAPALLRALEHPRPAIRDKAMQSLVTSGDAATVRSAAAFFDSVEGSGRKAWLEAVRLHLPADEVVSVYQRLLADPRQRPTHEMVLDQAEQLEPKTAVKVFKPWIGHEPPGAVLTIAGLRHAAGDSAGTVVLRDALHDETPQVRMQALQALRFGEPGDLLDDVVRLVDDPDPDVRAALLDVLRTVPGEHVDRAIETLSQDESLPVRRGALRLLVQRGRTGVLDDIVAELRTATGTRLRLAMEDLVAAGYGGAVPVLVERMQAAPDNEKREFLRTIALTSTPEAFGPLRDAFVSGAKWAQPDEPFFAYLMTNCRGAEGAMIALFRELPKSDYLRRALMMKTLASVAADRSDPEIAAKIHALLRDVLRDREEIPQMRLFALELLRRALTPDDVLEIRRMMREEDPPMRRALSDFLWEFF